MIKRYKIDPGRYEADIYKTDLDDVKEIVYSSERYVDKCWDSLIESMNENYSGFEFNGREWNCYEVLSAIDEEYVTEWCNSEAEYQCEENIPYEYDDQLENLGLGETVEIPETGCTVTLIEMSPETPEEEEELGTSYASIVTEAATLL